MKILKLIFTLVLLSISKVGLNQKTENFSFTLLDDYKLSDSVQFFFTGEYHYLKRSKNVHRFWAQKLVSDYNFDIILFETGIAHAFIGNLYMQGQLTDDEEREYKYLLKDYKFIKEILPDTLLWDLKIIGINYNQSLDEIFFSLHKLLPKKHDNPTISMFIKNVYYARYISYSEMQKVYYELIDHYKKSPQIFDLKDGYKNMIFKQLMQSYRPDFNSVNFNKNSYKYDYAHPMNRKREEFLFNNMRIIYELYPNSKYYGQFGLNHIPKLDEMPWSNYKIHTSCVAKFNQYLGDKENKLVSMPIIYYRTNFIKYNRNHGCSNSLLSKIKETVPDKKKYYIIKSNQPEDCNFGGSQYAIYAGGSKKR